ncbi:MAG TPA: tRNA lysidine(34) synthetase TilS [Gammaproteobacteria bacterium]|nr:tRNA lysidine(34) synthetase TilS [Gammaproteobacteria bacterium]
MDDFLARLARRLTELERAHAPMGVAVAYSGGLDSTVLLAACRRLDLSLPVRALHVDHGLHAESGRWARHCADIARSLDVELRSLRISVSPGGGQSLEAVARERRYAALAEMLEPREMLLTAHHADDQLETVLMRLFRGAGVRGLRGILESGPFATGFIGRPLLAFGRAELRAVAITWQLDCLEDPANRDLRFDRNYVRSVVAPAIAARWPGVARTVTGTAARMAEAEDLLDALAVLDAGELSDPARVPAAMLRGLAVPRQRNLLRHLLTRCRLPLPSARQLDELVAALAVERRDAQARVHWPGAEARVYGGYLYLMAELLPPSSTGEGGMLGPCTPWIGPEGRLELCEASSAGTPAALPETWIDAGLSVRFRTGGERLRLRGHHRELKKLLQEARVVPWMRSRIPLLFREGELVAVGDLWVADPAEAEGRAGRAWRVRWTEHPPLY